MPKPTFQFKQFTIRQDRCAMKVSTDGVLFGAWVDVTAARRVLDIGTGTGLLALIAAQHNTTALIDAVEIDDEAAEQATANVEASPWRDRVRVHRMDVRRMSSAVPYDRIICNPPYYARYSSARDERTGLAKHSGELLFPELIAAVDRLLSTDGRFAVIIPLNREKEFLAAAREVGLAPVRRCTVKYVAHRPAKRVLLDLDHSGALVREEELTIEASGPFDYTPEYRALIRDLMLGF